jgi:hypothetical protein
MYQVGQDRDAFTYDVGDLKLCTHGISACIGIAVLNRTQNWGGLLHYSDPTVSDDEVRGFLEEAISRVANGDEIEVWYGGCDDTENRAYARRGRKKVEAEMADYFPSAGAPEWLGSGQEFFYVEIHADTGQINVDRQSY